MKLSSNTITNIEWKWGRNDQTNRWEKTRGEMTKVRKDQLPFEGDGSESVKIQLNSSRCVKKHGGVGYKIYTIKLEVMHHAPPQRTILYALL